MKYIINGQVVLSQPPQGPLAVHIAPFAAWLEEQGYALYSLHRQVLIAACFSRWLGQKGIGSREVSPECAARFLGYRARRRRICRGDAAALRHLIHFLRGRGVIPAEKIQRRQCRPAYQCAQAFEQYLREERALANATVINYMPFIRCFLDDRFGDGPVRLSRLCAGDIVQFVQRQAPRLHRKRAKLLTAALRSFLRYARYRGDITLDLAAAVPTVANWSMTSIPRAISAEQVRQLLARSGRRTATERRDYAIMLLLTRLGLRSSEVVMLELDDIAWEAGSLRVRGKGDRRTELPLPADVGNAIVAYLRHGRPRSSSRRVFLRAKAPIRGFLGASAVGSIVRHALERTGIAAPTKGTHQFRHGLAAQMLHHGASLSEIGEVLGHRSPETTKIYAKVDLDALRTLALPWPGGVR
jgi:integrase/recombinase XerD